MEISLTVFASIFDNKTNRHIKYKTFDEFEKSLYDLSKIEGYKAKRGEFVVSKKASPLISPAVYTKGSTRSNDHVIKWAGWCALDIDNHDFKGDLKTELFDKYGKYYYICYSTASSTVEHPKFRLVFPLTRDIEANEIKHFWFALNTEFDSLGDKQTKDLSRMYYIPGNYPNAYNFIFTNKGISLDPDLLMKKHHLKEEQHKELIDRLPIELQKKIVGRQRALAEDKSSRFTWTSYDDCPFVNKKLINEYKSISHTDGSGRYSLFYKIMTSIACNAVRYKYPINEWEISTLMLQLDKESSNRYSKRPLKVEAARAIEYAYKSVKDDN